MEYYPEEFEEKLGHRFKDRGLLIQALTHSSCAHEMGDISLSNERLEFLGDAILDFVVSELLYKEYSDVQEGMMTEMRAAVVCEKALSDYSKTLNLGNYIMLGRGEAHTQGNERASILADTFEAIVAALYLDGGIEVASNFILPFVRARLKTVKTKGIGDYKTALQEIIQRNKGEMLTYRLVEESGPPHNRHFVMEVLLNSNVIGRGEGHSKKEAAQNAAMEALELMGCL